jgi:DNA-binding transcriptional LysR family regulator
VELRQLRYFIAVAEELHFTRAAARLHIAQPPLSQQIRQLELELRTPLLRRSSRHVELTAAGEAFLEEARRTLAQAERAAQVARQAASGPTAHLRLGFVDSSLHGYVPQLLRRFRRDHPGVHVTLREASSGQQVEAIQRGELQVGLLRPTRGGSQLALEEIGRERLVAALPSDHPLAERAEIAVDDLDGQPLVFFQRAIAPGLHDQLMGLFRGAGFTPMIVEEASEGHTIVGLVAAGLGVSLVPETLSFWRERDVVYRPLADSSAGVAMCVGWRRGDRSDAVASFLATARAARDQGLLPRMPGTPPAGGATPEG